VESLEINKGTAQDGIRRVKTGRGIAGDRVEKVENVAHSICPEAFGKLGSEERRADEISHSAICPLSNTIKGRRMRGARLMMNARGKEVGFKSFRNVFTAIVRTKGENLIFSVFFEESLKNLETGKDF
jgi:hypothetical protein